MPRRSNTRERILDKAFELIGKRGLMGFSMRDLAEEVGITEAAIYRHFRSKEDLTVNVIHHRLKPYVMDIIKRSVEEALQRRSLNALAEQFLGHIKLIESDFPKLRSLIMESYALGREELKRALLEVLKGIHTEVAELVKRLQEMRIINSDLSPEAVAFILIALKNSLLFVDQLKLDLGELGVEGWLDDQRRRDIWKVLEIGLLP